MTRRVHLPARVPNAGALRLWRWLSKRAVSARGGLARAIGEVECEIGAGKVQRLLSGELLPCAIMGEQLAFATDKAVDARGWRTATREWWNVAAPGPMIAPGAALRQQLIEGGGRLVRASALPRPQPRKRRAA